MTTGCYAKTMNHGLEAMSMNLKVFDNDSLECGNGLF
jgi:hypothetical protein